MAGMGPPPKDPRLRQRTNRKSTAASLSGARRGRLPELPERPCPCGGAPPAPPALPKGEKRRGRPPKPRPACEHCGGTGILPWHSLTLRWWRDVWHSPMAREFSIEADKHSLWRLAVLVDAFWGNPSDLRLASEIRLQQQAFGLTPLDRRRLDWTVETEANAKPSSVVEHDDADDGPDPRGLLRAVK